MYPIDFLNTLAKLSFPLAFVEEKHGHTHVSFVKSADGLYKRACAIEGVATLVALDGNPHVALRALCAKLQAEGRNVLCTHSPYAIIIEIRHMFDDPNKLAVYVETRKKHTKPKVLGVFRKYDNATAWVEKQRASGTIGTEYANNTLTKRYRNSSRS